MKKLRNRIKRSSLISCKNHQKFEGFAFLREEKCASAKCRVFEEDRGSKTVVWTVKNTDFGFSLQEEGLATVVKGSRVLAGFTKLPLPVLHFRTQDNITQVGLVQRRMEVRSEKLY